MFNDLISIIFPKLCACCKRTLVKNEDLLCFNCRAELPRTMFHLQKDNIVQKRLWGRVDVKMATAFLYFDKAGMVQEIIHQLKYKNRPEIGELMGILLGNELAEIQEEISIDYIVPVPLHAAKLHKRGYNQSNHFAMGISKTLDIPNLENLLSREIYTESQTKKGRMDRWSNVENVFKLNQTIDIEGKHILLVDDVITTGATLEACANKLLKKDITLSIATIASTH